MLHGMRRSSLGARLGLACFMGGLALAGAGSARANGRYPAAGLVALDPSDPLHIVVRATYGLVSTQDGGLTWRWVCEQSVGFSDNEDPMVAITQNGTLLAGVFKGLAVSTDRACDWTFVGGELADRYAVDLSTEKGDPSRAVAILSNGIGGGKFKTQVFESLDNGGTWTQAGVNLPEDFLGLTIDAAPSDPQRLYASGRFGAMDGYAGALERSVDRGATWERFDIPGSDDKHPPYLSAVDPNNPDVVYVRLDAAEADSLVVSKDGGATWETAFEGEAGLLGFALSPDGSKVAVGGDKDGLWIAPTDTLAFTKVSNIEVRCLLWSGDTIFACADEFEDGFHVGTSKDEGKTFQALENLAEICPLECGAETTTGAQCPVRWGALALTIDATSCEDPDAGTGAGGSGAGASGAGAGGGTTPPSGDGCGVAGGSGSGGCGIGSGGFVGGAALLGTAAFLAAARRTRRKRPQR